MHCIDFGGWFVGGTGFVQWDVNSGDLPATVQGRRLDYVIVSYVLEMYMSEDSHCDMMEHWLRHDGVRAVSSDTPDHGAYGLFPYNP